MCRLAFSLVLFGLLSTSVWAELPQFDPNKGKPPPAPEVGEEEDGLDDEFSDLLSDNPKPRKKKKKKKKKKVVKKADDGPVATWGVDSGPPKGAGGPALRIPAQAVKKRTEVLDGELPEAPKVEKSKLRAVDWDVDEPDLPKNAVPVVHEVSVILSNQIFYPAKVQLAAGQESRMYFTVTGEKPAALIIERLNIQRWVAKKESIVSENDVNHAPWEVTKELSRNRVTEILIKPGKGNYSFYDAISGARGELVVK